MYRKLLIRVLPAASAIGLQLTNNRAKCDALLENTNLNEYIEPISKVRFQGAVVPQLDLPNPLKLVSAGVRCMLGDSARCDRAITRVYSYGLYISPAVFHSLPRPSFDDALFNSPHIAKTLVLEVTTSKSAGHWCGGFNKTIGRRMLSIKQDAESRKKSFRAKKTWCKQFKKIQSDKWVPHGTIIEITWYQGKVTTAINGKISTEIEDDVLGQSIFKSYYGLDSVNPAVERKAREHYKHGIQPFEINQQNGFRERGVCPEYRKCGERLSFW